MIVRHSLRIKNGRVHKEFVKRQHFRRELNALESLQPHPFVAELLEHAERQTKVKFWGVIVMPYYRGCDLHTWLEAHTDGTEIRTVRYIFKKVLIALDYAKKMGYYHRDVKLENIVLDARGNVKLIDWELSTTDETTDRRVGTAEYMAFEVINQTMHSCEKADVWSLAVTLFVLATGKRPYSSQIIDGEQYYNENLSCIFRKRWKRFWAPLPKVSSDFKACIQAMLAKDPCKRPTYEDLMFFDIFAKPEACPREVEAEIRRTINEYPLE